MPRAGLTQQKIAVAALDLIDEIGIDEFSMRKLAPRLGVGPMAIYRHFDHQEDLFDAVAGHLFDKIDPESLSWDAPWSALATEYCRRMAGVLLAHPHAVTTFATRPVRSPSSITTGVRMIEVFTAAGFTPADGLRIARSLREFTIGHALSLAVVQRGTPSRSRKPEPGDANYNLLAEAADSTELDDHFGMALSAMIFGFEKMRSDGQAIDTT